MIFYDVMFGVGRKMAACVGHVNDPIGVWGIMEVFAMFLRYLHYKKISRVTKLRAYPSSYVQREVSTEALPMEAPSDMANTHVLVLTNAFTSFESSVFFQ